MPDKPFLFIVLQSMLCIRFYEIFTIPAQGADNA